ncbi:PLP-dependent aminotransferase family protein [Chitinophaga sp. 22321]|uniref:PLP-dependent aminotransferase family protein n=1 Tax=Chitinophaga hostae TaxID=2831022 RepID=A0ABS5J9W3_9BACT|nr:PLP-dependent aminotransferase family protein [Chitinophaga hostae]MBS0031999.1 PLP-dependent aminotransferase family protein [Chitinophaga hostae]
MKQYRYEEIAADIESKITGGQYLPGHKLPSVRAQKERYQTSLSTIQSAYDDLLLKGLVESVPRSGYFVRTRPEPLPKAGETMLIRDPVFRNNLAAITSENLQRSALSEFNVAAPGDLLLPQQLLLKTMQQVIREKGAALLKYYPANGLAALREAITKRAAHYNTRLQANELLITDGALQAIYIALSAVCAPGDVIAIESPCIFSVLEVIRVLRLKVVEIPIQPRTGFDIAALQAACSIHALKAVVVTPNFHNPTGALMSDEQKRWLLQVAQTNNMAIIENDIYGELFFNGQRPCTIRSFDNSGLVMTCSSFAKSLAPGVRLGWLSPGRFYSQAEQIRFAIGSAVSPVYQETILRIVDSSAYEKHLRTFRQQLQAQCNQSLRLIKDYFPAGTRVAKPQGGYHLWVQLPEQQDTASFYRYCAQAGVRFTPGSAFSFSNRYDQYFRLVFADKYTPAKEAALRKAGAYAATPR